MSGGKTRRSFAKSRWNFGRLAAIWLAGLLGAFAVGLYLLGPSATTPDAQEETAAAPAETLPAEIAVESFSPPSAESD